jgi:hypothetical protein
MNRKTDILLSGVACVALGFVSIAQVFAAPNQSSAAPAESAHASAAPAAPAERAPAPEPTRSAPAPTQQPTASPRTNPAPADTNQGGVNQVQQNIINRSNAQANQQAAGGAGNQNHIYGYANGYYPLGYASAFWNPNWSPYGQNNNYNGYGPEYPAQFSQPPEDSQTEPPSVNSQVIPDVAPQIATPTVPAEPQATSAALKLALIASPQWRDADEQVRIAQSQYDSASGIVLAQLRTQPAYQRALAQKAADAQKVASLKAKDPAAPIDRTEAVATAKLDAAQTVTQMENAAIAADPHASAAKIKLDTAIAQRQEARLAVESSLPHPAPQQQ